MTHRWIGRTLFLGTLTALFLSTGCQSPGGADMLAVVLPQDRAQTVAVGSGPMLLANSTWAGFRIAEAGEEEDARAEVTPRGPYGSLLNGGVLDRPPAETQIFLADFGEDGSFTAIRENRYFLPDIYGETMPVDGKVHNASIPGLQFRPVSFGVSEGDEVAMAVVVDVTMIGLRAGTATIYAWGTVEGDRLDGVFGYQIEFVGLFAVLPSGGDQYMFYAIRQQAPE